MMQLGVDGVFVGSGIFKSGDPDVRARAIVKATTHYNDPEILADVSANLGEPMVGRTVESLAASGTNCKSWLVKKLVSYLFRVLLLNIVIIFIPLDIQH